MPRQAQVMVGGAAGSAQPRSAAFPDSGSRGLSASGASTLGNPEKPPPPLESTVHFSELIGSGSELASWVCPDFCSEPRGEKLRALDFVGVLPRECELSSALSHLAPLFCKMGLTLVPQEHGGNGDCV